MRGNNPGNIRRVQGTPWVGEIIPTPWVPGFVVFDTLENGYRAMFILLNSYLARGYNTIEKIITRWAPPTENNTAAYINFVSSYTGTPPDYIIEEDSSALWEVGLAMSEMEQAGNITASDIGAATNAFNKLTGAAQTASLGWPFIILGILFGLTALNNRLKFFA